MNTASPIEKALGLEPGEAYGEDEQCFTNESTHTYKGRSFEVYFDEMAGPFSQWGAFCVGIGTITHWDRKDVILKMRKAIEY